MKSLEFFDKATKHVDCEDLVNVIHLAIQESFDKAHQRLSKPSSQGITEKVSSDWEAQSLQARKKKHIGQAKIKGQLLQHRNVYKRILHEPCWY